MKIVVIGNGMVGYKFCEKLCARITPGAVDLVVFGEEPRPAYDRVHLTSWFDGKTAEELLLATPEWYTQKGIRLHLGDPVIRIDREHKMIYAAKGAAEAYDYLIMATGSAAFVPPVPGIDKKGVFIYRTIEDLEMMKAHAQRAKTGAVIGGGLLGLEAAKALLDLGIRDAHVIEFSSRLMPRQIDEKGSVLLQGKLEELGLKVLTNRNTKVITGDEYITGLQFTDDTFLQADMLVISAGIRPRDELAIAAGLETGARGGIVVNEQLQTSDPSIYAIGECALYNNMIYGLVAPGYEMAEVVAAHISGELKAFTGFDMSTKLKLIGVDVASFGDPFTAPENCRSIVFEDKYKGVYKRIDITPDGRQLLGGILIGEAEAYNLLLQTAKNKLVLPADPESLLLGPARKALPVAPDWMPYPMRP